MKNAQVDAPALRQATQIISDAIRELTAKRETLVSEKLALKKHVLHLWGLPARDADIKAMVLREIDHIGSQFPTLAGWEGTFNAYRAPRGWRPPLSEEVDLSGQNLVKHQGGSLTMLDAAYVGSRGSLNSLAGVDGDFFSGASGAGADRDAQLKAARAYFFFGDVIKEKVSRFFDNHAARQSRPVLEKTGDAALTFAECQEQISAAEMRIEAIAAEVAAIDQQLAELPDNERTKREIGQRLGFKLD